MFQVTPPPSLDGFTFSTEYQAAMPDALCVDASAYNEDLNWSLAVIAFPAELKAAGDNVTTFEINLAHQTAGNWHSNRYAASTGKPVKP